MSLIAHICFQYASYYNGGEIMRGLTVFYFAMHPNFAFVERMSAGLTGSVFVCVRGQHT